MDIYIYNESVVLLHYTLCIITYYAGMNLENYPCLIIYFPAMPWLLALLVAANVANHTCVPLNTDVYIYIYNTDVYVYIHIHIQT